MAGLVIPGKLAASVVAWEGDSGRRWLAALPRLVAEVAEAWDLEIGPPLEPGGNISWVAPARRRSDGRDAVLKMQHPHPESEPEALGLAAWAGRGAVLLLAHDAERRALLLERCEPGSALLDERGTLEAVRTGAALGARLHAVAPPAGLPALAVVLDGWADTLEGQLERTRVIDPALGALALDVMRRRPRACREPGLLHGDLNPTNLLAARREPWLAIDPKPMLGDPAYDGPRLVLQPDPLASPDPEATFAARVDVVAGEMGLDRDVLLAWCLVNAVEMGAGASSRGDRARAERCAAQLSLIARHLP